MFTRYIDSTFIAPLGDTDDPVTTLTENLLESGRQMRDKDVALGCPLDHFAEEMAPISTDFQQRIHALYQRKQNALTAAFHRGQAAGNVTTHISAESIALFFQATLQGCMGLAKNARSLDTLIQCGECLLHYLEQLRPENNPVPPKPTNLKLERN